MEKTKVWLYCRTAEKNGDEAMKRQEILLRQAADAKQHEIVGSICEYASGNNIDRMTLCILMDYARDNVMNEIWVINESRISRDINKINKWIKDMAAFGVTVCMLNGGEMVPIKEHCCEAQMIEAIAEIESQYEDWKDEQEIGLDDAYNPNL